MGYDKVVGIFGSGILNSDGEVNRRFLGVIVFSDEVRWKLLYVRFYNVVFIYIICFYNGVYKYGDVL